MAQKKMAGVSLVFIIIGLAAPVSAQLKKIRFSNSAISISELPFKVAQVKGFYREEGLDVEAILIRGAVGMQALLGGSVDYTSASGSTLSADGSVDELWMKGAIEFTQRSLGSAAKEAPPSQVFDFSFVQKAVR
jgi:ABC-type nitrate/sulfonate/bicarbonate transport system substrate-binding protein